MTFNPVNSLGPFLNSSTYFPENFEEFRIRFIELYSQIAQMVNVRDSGIYNEREFLTSQTWSTSGDPLKPRYTYRKIFFIGAIAAGATSTTAHGLTNVTTYTRIYGTAITAASDNRPIPYASATVVTDQIEINTDATNITIINGATAPNITSSIAVLEYLKN